MNTLYPYKSIIHNTLKGSIAIDSTKKGLESCYCLQTLAIGVGAEGRT
jgi:hypothetical protein